MLKYRDFVPKQIEAPGFLTPGVHESFEAAVVAANDWLATEELSLIHISEPTRPY